MIYFVLIFFGLALGSFVNALVWRVHQQEEAESRKQKAKSKNTAYSIQSTEYSILKGRSMCPSCKHELAAKDLIPVLSWLSLGGKCRYCKKPIHWQYPLVEVITAGLFVASFVFWPEHLCIKDASTENIFNVIEFGAWLVTLTGLIALFIYDLKWMILPTRIIFPLVVIAAAVVAWEGIVLETFQPIVDSTIGAVLLGGFFYLLFMVSDGKWIGGGDVRLGVLMGILLGPALSLLALFIASLLGSIITIGLMIGTKMSRKQQVPFGPFLIAATFIAVIWGQQLIDWYSENFLGGAL